MREHDDSDRIIESIYRCSEEAVPVAIRGHGSKRCVTGTIDGTPVHTSDHTGVVGYEPDELVLTVRSGTPLKGDSGITGCTRSNASI